MLIFLKFYLHGTTGYLCWGYPELGANFAFSNLRAVLFGLRSLEISWARLSGEELFAFSVGLGAWEKIG